VAWAVLVVVLVILSVSLLKILTETRTLVEGVREQTVPLLGEVRTSVITMNKNLEHSDDLLASVGNVARTVERISGLFDQLVSTPLIKGISYGYGAQRAAKRFRGK
jgi:ABC-type transporter Mla subunit MlaD